MSPKVSEEHRESKRREILDAAVRVFIRQGFPATTMTDVVEESGLSRGGVYLYFSGTEEMFLAIVEEVELANERQAEELMAQYPTVWGAVAALFIHLQEELVRVREGLIPVMIEAFVMGWRKEVYTDLLERRYEQGTSRIERMLQVGVDNGEFRPRLPIGTIARMFSSINDGIMVDTMQFGAEDARTQEQIGGFLLSLRYLLGACEEEERP
ncbi:TetR family transcriptional regulator [Cohnella nanjingensis]|uniref:TetR family transcriptional regulator n=1 Tax=Cohnella nanjingensis TaxID=1387779 RepID=A0A7X0RVV9_9BACL|nr:TetR family transcriptional regulator [Cohnella nanjingensis]MBB6674556.1 TetR family transcriptional regulator [Cohnella nanjingensis]